MKSHEAAKNYTQHHEDENEDDDPDDIEAGEVSSRAFADLLDRETRALLQQNILYSQGKDKAEALALSEAFATAALNFPDYRVTCRIEADGVPLMQFARKPGMAFADLDAINKKPKPSERPLPPDNQELQKQLTKKANKKLKKKKSKK